MLGMLIIMRLEMVKVVRVRRFTVRAVRAVGVWVVLRGITRMVRQIRSTTETVSAR